MAIRKAVGTLQEGLRDMYDDLQLALRELSSLGQKVVSLVENLSQPAWAFGGAWKDHAEDLRDEAGQA